MDHIPNGSAAPWIPGEEHDNVSSQFVFHVTQPSPLLPVEGAWPRLQDGDAYEDDHLTPVPPVFSVYPQSTTPEESEDELDQSETTSKGAETTSEGEESDSELGTDIVNLNDLDLEEWHRRVESLYNTYRPKTPMQIEPFQKEGIMFILRCLLSREGPRACLLAHVMGCGKTMQVITALAIIANAVDFNSPNCVLIPNHLRELSTLILCPASLVDNWAREFEKWAPSRLCRLLEAPECILSSSKLTDHQTQIHKWERLGGVLIMSYDMLRTLIRDPKIKGCLRQTPDLVVADEVHLLSNPLSKRAQACRIFSTKTRIGLSGTPMANNEKEYDNILRWIMPGQNAISKYITPIKYLSPGDSGETGSLLPTISPVSQKVLASRVHRVGVKQLARLIPRKVEFTLIIPLTELQKRAYNVCIGLAPENGVPFFTMSQLLSACCAHPSLLRRHTGSSRPGSVPANISQALLDVLNECDDETSVNHSYRTTLIDHIVQESIQVGDKVVIFSESLATLDYLVQFLKLRGRKYFRLDGSVAVEERVTAINSFNNSNSNGTNVALISTKSGGMGFNITGANRLIIFDFGYNPIHEEQAIGRVYRMGQQKPVFVYRLIGGGTYEEEIYNATTLKLKNSSETLGDKFTPRHEFNDPRYYKSPLRDVIKQDLYSFRGMDEVLDRILCLINQPIANMHMSVTDGDDNDWDPLFDE